MSFVHPVLETRQRHGILDSKRTSLLYRTARLSSPGFCAHNRQIGVKICNTPGGSKHAQLDPRLAGDTCKVLLRVRWATRARRHQQDAKTRGLDRRCHGAGWPLFSWAVIWDVRR
ncbi:hypothetical protein Trco_001898 [Trichoderma cornu-damae]|uniref:Uncharacterized protein n=1 Tax=Trichoderma cornu-damae TaxID=654480 RepID=A0A9P8QTW8_9HYPO|nr:hypothetical protein Trco_001898 [Trichoderma cornu-damae]